MVGQIVRQVILLQRAQRCEHEWVRLNDTEDQCSRCSIIATAEGKKNLARMFPLTPATPQPTLESP